MSRELDAKVAEKVLDTHWVRAYTTDPAADYEVLKHVREKWDDGKRTQFCALLRDVWADRAAQDGWRNSYQQFYEPGDYSKAALMALGEDIG